MAPSWLRIHDVELSTILSILVDLGVPPSILCPNCKAPIKLGVRKTSFLYRCGKDAYKRKTINLFSKSPFKNRNLSITQWWQCFVMFLFKANRKTPLLFGISKQAFCAFRKKNSRNC